MIHRPMKLFCLATFAAVTVVGVANADHFRQQRFDIGVTKTFSNRAFVTSWYTPIDGYHRRSRGFQRNLVVTPGGHVKLVTRRRGRVIGIDRIGFVGRHGRWTYRDGYSPRHWSRWERRYFDYCHSRSRFYGGGGRWSARVDYRYTPYDYRDHRYTSPDWHVGNADRRYDNGYSERVHQRSWVGQYDLNEQPVPERTRPSSLSENRRPTSQNRSLQPTQEPSAPAVYRERQAPFDRLDRGGVVTGRVVYD